MALTTSQAIAAQVALAYFGRPQDTGALAIFGSNLVSGSPTAAQLATQFATTESKVVFGSSPTISSVIARSFEMVGRVATSQNITDIATWATSSRLDISQLPWEIMKIALSTESLLPQASQVAWARLAVAYQFSEDVSANATALQSLATSTTSQESARAVISGVTSFATISTAYPATGTGTVASFLTTTTSSSGQTFTLTTAADSSSIVGSAGTNSTIGSDTFNAVIGTDGLVANGTTLNPGDNLSGGAGNDTLALSASGTHGLADITISAVSLSSIETITFSNFQTNDARDTIVDLSLASGVTTLAQTSSSASGDTGFTGVKAIVAAKLQNGAGDLSITYADTAVVSTADIQTLELSAVTAGTFTVAAATGGVETLAITSTGSAANVLTGIANAGTLKTITVAGTQNVTLGTLQAAVTTVNASASAAGVIAIAGQAVDYAITGGVGNDTLTVTAANISAADTITGGSGIDTIKLDAGVTAANMANVTGFEVLEITANAAAGQTVDGLLSGVTKLVSSATDAANNVSFTNVGSAVTELQVTGTEGIIASLKTNGTADAVTLTYGSSTAGFTAIQTTLNDYETISIVSQGGANNTGAFGANQITKMNASGSQALTIGATTAAALATIDASGMTKNFIMTDNTSTVASTITGGTGNDTLFGSTKADVITGGVGNDAITAGAGADNLSGGDGNDTFTVVVVADFTTAVETVAGGAGDDTLSIATAGNAVITLIAANLAAISSIETLSLNSGTGASSVTLTDAVYTANGQTLKIVDANLTTGTLTVDGSALTAANSLAITANTVTGANGTDTLTGGAGNDTFTFSTEVGLEAVDTVVGGAGTDTIFLTATANVTAVLTGVRTVENVTTTGTGGNIIITVGADAVIAASSTLTTSAASSTTTANTLTYDGSLVTTATKVQNVTGTSGDDGITGGTGNDIISGGDGADAITGGAGIDNLSGGAGIDTFTVALAAQFIGLATVETVSGGSGNDILSFATAVGFTVAAADLAAINSIETIQFLSTTESDTLTLSDTVFTANAVTALKIDAAAVTTGDFILAASGLSAANSVTVTRTGDNNAGTGDNIVLGAGDDTLKVRIDILDNATTTLTGGAGNDTLTLSTTVGATTMTALVTGFEKINFAADIAATITTRDANVAAGVTFTVDGTALITTNVLTFNGAAELDGKFSITGGAAADVLTGGALADTISGGLSADTITGSGGADSITGGVGADVFVYTSASVAHSTGTTADTITDFATLSDKLSVTLNYSAVSSSVQVNTALVATVGDLSAQRGEFVYDSTAGALTINVNNDNLLTTQDIKINMGTVVAADLIFNITGSTSGDTLTGGVGADTIASGGGADSITGGGGIDSITGGGGVDTVVIGTAQADVDIITAFTSTADKVRFSGALLNVADAALTDAGDISGSATVNAAIAVSAVGTQYVFSNAAFDINASVAAFIVSQTSTTAAAITTAARAALNATAMTNLDATFLTSETVLFVLDGTAATASAIFTFKNTTAAGNTINDGELVLVGVVDANAILATGDIIL